ncbi:MAG TPA: hypothetical protein GX716_07535 [Firmicutes bacterium]|nr:hypothetical protein [Candidatus Fermentithermobacillaceae bacterium]
MSRRSLLITAVLIFSLVCIHSAVSYTSAAIGNGVELTITDPYHGLVSFVACSSGSLDIKQGESNDVLIVTNNLGQGIYNLKATISSCHPRSVRDYLSLGSLYPDSLAPGKRSVVTLSAADDCPVGPVTLTVALEAEFDGGSARVLADLSVTVVEGQLTLLPGDDGFTASWNGGDSPDGTVILYRYRPVDGQEGDWTGWQEINGASLGETLPGYYEYKAVLGKTESEVISRYVEPPAEPEDIEVLDADASADGGESGGEESTAENETEK